MSDLAALKIKIARLLEEDEARKDKLDKLMARIMIDAWLYGTANFTAEELLEAAAERKVRRGLP